MQLSFFLQFGWNCAYQVRICLRSSPEIKAGGKEILFSFWLSEMLGTVIVNLDYQLEWIEKCLGD
jgi:hypothetical protein